MLIFPEENWNSEKQEYFKTQNVKSVVQAVEDYFERLTHFEMLMRMWGGKIYNHAHEMPWEK